MNLLTNIRGRLKRTFDRIGNERLKTGILQAIPFWFASLLTGIVAVLFARLFSLSESVCFGAFRKHEWWLFIMSPICFVGAWWVVNRFAPYARGSGIPQVMAAIDLS